MAQSKFAHTRPPLRAKRTTPSIMFTAPTSLSPPAPLPLLPSRQTNIYSTACVPIGTPISSCVEHTNRWGFTLVSQGGERQDARPPDKGARLRSRLRRHAGGARRGPQERYSLHVSLFPGIADIDAVSLLVYLVACLFPTSATVCVE